MTLKVGLLGPLQVTLASRPVQLPSGRLPALLAVLAMSAGQTVPADRLAAAVWGEDPSVDARANVQSNVRRLRRELGADLVTTRGGGYALAVETDHVDALRFVRLLDLAASAPDPATERDRLGDALQLWRGTPFDGVRSDWLERMQYPRLLERYLAAVERRIDLDLASGRDSTLVAELGELTARHPLRESLWVRLLVTLERAGRPAEALERYETIRIRLADELGADPGPALQQVHADLLAGTALRLPGAALPSTWPSNATPSSASPATPRVVPRQLPADIDVFAGRDDALKALDRLLGDRDDSTPRAVMVSVIAGTAGIGKTALAVHWAHRVADRFPDGQLYVNLRGFDPSGSPVDPAEAVRGFLDALQVRSALTGLARAHLVAEHTPGRYALHDLLRAYAAELVRIQDAGAERQAAVRRMVDHYLHTAHEADLLLFRHGETITLAPPQPCVSPEHLSDQDQAMAWFTAEHPVLIALIDQTVRDGSHHSTCHLASALQVFLHRRGHWHARAATQRAALAAARRLGDRAAQARAHRSLGFASADLERYDDAHLHLGRAIELSGDAGDLVGQAWAHHYRDLVYGSQGRDADALQAAQRALHLFQAADDQVGQAIALSDVGWYHGRLGNHQQALAFCGQALTLHQELDNRAYQAHTWSCLGDTHHRLGDDPQAIDCYRHALDLFRELGDRYGEASALIELGESQQDAGDPAAARRSRQEAQAILDELDPPAAGQIRARFHGVDEPTVEALVLPD